MMCDRVDGMGIWAMTVASVAYAKLPLELLAEISYGLELRFDRCLSQGQFLYGGEPLRISGRCEEIRRSSQNSKLKIGL